MYRFTPLTGHFLTFTFLCLLDYEKNGQHSVRFFFWCFVLWSCEFSVFLGLVILCIHRDMMQKGDGFPPDMEGNGRYPKIGYISLILVSWVHGLKSSIE